VSIEFVVSVLLLELRTVGLYCSVLRMSLECGILNSAYLDFRVFQPAVDNSLTLLLFTTSSSDQGNILPTVLARVIYL
jgi:hypothetical protein